MSNVARRLVMRLAESLPLSVRRSISRWPLVGRLQRAVFQGVVSGAELETLAITAGPLTGRKLVLDIPSEKSFWPGTFELPVAERLASEIRPGDVCWDVGSHIGYFSVLMGHCGAKTVYCFEPLPANRDRLAKQAIANADLNMVIVPKALAAEIGETTLLVNPGDASMGKLSTSTFQQDREVATEIRVALDTIDHLVREDKYQPPTFLKIDTEGTEFQVLTGARETLLQHRPRILLEYHGCSDDRHLAALFTAAGYQATIVETGQAFSGEAAPGNHLWCVPIPNQGRAPS